MPSRRRKKPPDEPLSLPLSIIWPNLTHSPDLPISSHRLLPLNRALRIVVGFSPFFTPFAVPPNAAEGTGSDFEIWVVHRSVLVYLHCSGYFSSVWWSPVGQVGSALCEVDTVSAMVTFQPSNRPRLDTVRYGMAILRCSPPPISSQVWVLPSLSLWIYLTPPNLVEYCWKCGWLIDMWSRLIVASYTHAVISMGRPCSAIAPYCCWPSSFYHVVVGICTPSLHFMGIIGICWPLLDGVCLLMSSPPSSDFPVLGHDTGLVSPTVIGKSPSFPGEYQEKETGIGRSFLYLLFYSLMVMVVTYLWVRYMAPRVTMNVVCFWGYYLVQSLSTDCWVMCRWAYSTSILLGVVVSWSGFPLFHVHFAGGEVCWGLLMSDCTGHFNANAEFHVFSGLDVHLITIAIFSLVLLWPWFCFNFHCYPFFGVLPFRWIVSFIMIPELLLFYSILICFDLFSAPTPLTFTSFWWQVSFSPSSPFHMHSLSYSCLCCLDQHVHMLRLHPWMLEQSPNGEGFQLWMMLLLYSIADVGFESFLLWNFLSFLLSLLLAPKLAHTHAVWHTCVC